MSHETRLYFQTTKVQICRKMQAKLDKCFLTIAFTFQNILTEHRDSISTVFSSPTIQLGVFFSFLFFLLRVHSFGLVSTKLLHFLFTAEGKSLTCISAVKHGWSCSNRTTLQPLHDGLPLLDPAFCWRIFWQR